MNTGISSQKDARRKVIAVFGPEITEYAELSFPEYLDWLCALIPFWLSAPIQRLAVVHPSCETLHLCVNVRRDEISVEMDYAVNLTTAPCVDDYSVTVAEIRIVPHPSPHFWAAATGMKTPVVATASANFSISGKRRCSGMFGMRS